jgi:hypothetical protein
MQALPAYGSVGSMMHMSADVSHAFQACTVASAMPRIHVSIGSVLHGPRLRQLKQLGSIQPFALK